MSIEDRLYRDAVDDDGEGIGLVDISTLYLDLLQATHSLAERAEIDGLTVRLACPACEAALAWREAHQLFTCDCTAWRVVDLGVAS